MPYLHPRGKRYVQGGRSAVRLTRRPARRVRSSSSRELGRLGGEMARRMVEAALAYLTERSVAETRAAFTEAAHIGRAEHPAVTPNGPKA